MFEVTFQIEHADAITVSANRGDNLLEVARRNNVAIDAPCSGNGACGKCMVQLLSGKLESQQTAHISDEAYAAGWRLSCCSSIVDDLTVLVPDIASAYQRKMKTADLSSGAEIAIFEKLLAQIRQAGIGLDNSFQIIPLQLAVPSLEDTMPDSERLERALCTATGCTCVKITYAALRQMAATLRENDFQVQAVCETQDDRVTLYALCPPRAVAFACAAAIDIGTTTVSAVLMDLKTGRLLAKASTGNGQIRYGADVINRIIEQGKPGGQMRLQDAIVRETLQPLLQMLCREAGVESTCVTRLCIAGNTTMNHLLLAVDAAPVRMEPYIPSFFHYDGLCAAALDLPVHPEAQVILAPNIGSYVGGDITAGAFTSLIWNRPEYALLIDLGTNGELVFGNEDFLISCACSAGPAFEGGDISCGMRATDGAIEAVQLDRTTMEPTLTVVGAPGQQPVGICGSGIIDVIAELFRIGVIDPKGNFIRTGKRIASDTHGTSRYILAFAPQTATGREIAITQVDIAAFIRAKGAVYSAIDTMLRSLDFTPEMIEHVYVAGGIGSGININNAVRIGMFPDVPREKFQYIGNSSLAGAYAMALSDCACGKVEEIAANMTYLELSTYPGYMDHFVAACFLPHTDTGLFPSSRQE